MCVRRCGVRTSSLQDSPPYGDGVVTSNFAVIHVLFLCQTCARCSFTCTGPGSPLEGLDHVLWSSGGRLDHQITTKEIIIAYFFRNPHVLVHVQTACTCNPVVMLRDPIRCSIRIAHAHVLSPHFQLILHAIQVIYIYIYIYICTESAGFIYICIYVRAQSYWITSPAPHCFLPCGSHTDDVSPLLSDRNFSTDSISSFCGLRNPRSTAIGILLANLTNKLPLSVTYTTFSRSS